jgi:hypothetical protein
MSWKLRFIFTQYSSWFLRRKASPSSGKHCLSGLDPESKEGVIDPELNSG